MAPKSILKKPADDVTPSAAQSRDERNREIALYHANLIQAQKDIEAEILDSTETLIDFPSDAATTSAQPTDSDIAQFGKLIRPFTPNDYDELIEERRIDKKCGYVFCRKPPKAAGGGKFKIVGKQRGQDFRIVDRVKAECWCSNDCAKRALYIKVQLIEEPAWSRRSGSGPELEILTGEVEAAKLRADSAGKEDLDGALKDLARERGDETKPARAVGMIAETVVEKGTISAPTAPKRNEEGRDAIEGYMPKMGSSKESKKPLGDEEWGL